MKKIISKTALICGLIISVNTLFFILLTNGGWIAPIENIKTNFFNDSLKKTIYVIAGSSMGNSFDSEYVSSELAREVFNASFSLAHKSSFILNFISDQIKKEDIVVYGPEFDHYYDFDESISITQLASIYNNTELFKYQSYRQKIKFVLNVPKMNILLSYRMLKMLFKPHLFNKTTYNNRGDYTGHLKDKRSWVPSKESRYKRNNYDHKISVEFKENLLKAKLLIEEKGGHFFITFPPHPKSEFDDRFTIDLLSFYKNTGIKLIGKPNTYVFHDSLFLNHPYHTTLSGTRKRSQVFVEQLKMVTFD